jgi:hypothetical protein
VITSREGGNHPIVFPQLARLYEFKLPGTTPVENEAGPLRKLLGAGVSLTLPLKSL